MTEPAKLHISQFFTYDHLREPLRSVSEKFAKFHDALVAGVLTREEFQTGVNILADWCRALLPANPERDWCEAKLMAAFGEDDTDMRLRWLLEAKDCAVRATLAGPA